MKIISVMLLVITLLAGGIGAGANVPAASGPQLCCAKSAVDGPEQAAEPFLGGPSYDSGWQALGPGQSLSLAHNLDAPAELLYVDLEGRSTAAADGLHARAAGGADLGLAGDALGAYWYGLSETGISVQRRPQDTAWNWVRVRIWRMPKAADYSSGWTALDPGESKLFNHALGGPVDDLVVSLVFRDGGPLGVNTAALGGRDEGAQAALPGSRVGAHWFGLTNVAVSVLRLPEDTYASEVLVRVWKRPTPTFDSGWLEIAPGQTLQVSHAIGGVPEDMLVDVEYLSTADPAVGINQVYAGGRQAGAQALYNLSPGDQVGALWRALDAGSLLVERLAQDIFAAQVRVRIWNFWTPRQANFDSGWQSLDPGESRLLQHQAGGDPQRYLVDLQFKSLTYGITQRGLGGMDDQNWEEVGAYWQGLDGQSVTILRRNDDEHIARQARLRLWVMPRPDFDSGWADVAAGDSLILNHNLGGSPEDYLVELQFSGPELGTHLAGYGGYDITDPQSPRYGSHVGAAWQGLTTSTLTVKRGAGDLAISRVRVRIWRVSQPAWRTWTSVAPGDVLVLNHDLGYPAERYFVQLLFKNNGAAGLNQADYGGMFFGPDPLPGRVEGGTSGGYWGRLSETGIWLTRLTQDIYMDQAQVRLWVIPQANYIPFLSTAP